MGRCGRDEVMAAAMLDRLLHRCHVVNIQGTSYRMREYKAARAQTRRNAEKAAVATLPPPSPAGDKVAKSGTFKLANDRIASAPVPQSCAAGRGYRAVAVVDLGSIEHRHDAVAQAGSGVTAPAAGAVAKQRCARTLVVAHGVPCLQIATQFSMCA